MRSPRVLAASVAALAVISLGLVACGGSGGDSGGADSEKQAVVDQLMSELSGDGTITEDQKNCLRGKFNDFSIEDLKTIRDSQSDTEVPQALQEKVINMVMECVMPTEGASPSAS